MPKFAFPKTFINDPFFDFDIIQDNEIIPEISPQSLPIVFDEIIVSTILGILHFYVRHVVSL